MLKTSKNENWTGQSYVDDKTICTFYASIDNQGAVNSITMNPTDNSLYLSHLTEVMNDFQTFQSKVIESTKHWEV